MVSDTYVAMARAQLRRPTPIIHRTGWSSRGCAGTWFEIVRLAILNPDRIRRCKRCWPDD